MKTNLKAAALLLLAACGRPSDVNPAREAVMPMTAAKSARPAIDEARPTAIETATFALG